MLDLRDNPIKISCVEEKRDCPGISLIGSKTFESVLIFMRFIRFGGDLLFIRDTLIRSS